MWQNLQESYMLAHFSNSRLLHFLYLDSQRNDPPKFQPWKPGTFEATALQSDDSRKIDLYRDYTGKKPTGAYIIIIYEFTPLPRWNLHNQILHKQANALLEKFFLPCYSNNQGKGESLRKKFLQTTHPTQSKCLYFWESFSDSSGSWFGDLVLP